MHIYVYIKYMYMCIYIYIYIYIYDIRTNSWHKKKYMTHAKVHDTHTMFDIRTNICHSHRYVTHTQHTNMWHTHTYMPHTQVCHTHTQICAMRTNIWHTHKGMTYELCEICAQNTQPHLFAHCKTPVGRSLPPPRLAEHHTPRWTHARTYTHI